MAWATSAILLVGNGMAGEDGAAWDLTRILVSAAWLAVAWRCAGQRTRRLLARGIACLLIVAVPLQGLAAARLRIQGPAHFHSAGAHAHVERHFHPAGVDAVEVEHEHDRALTHAAQGKSAALGAVDAASAAAPALAPEPGASPVAGRLLPLSTEHRPALPERPPRRAALVAAR